MPKATYNGEKFICLRKDTERLVAMLVSKDARIAELEGLYSREIAAHTVTEGERIKYRDRIAMLESALKCSSENCSELGRFHDGDCSDCPQGMIRARCGLSRALDGKG
ncbi:hypothetical protein M0Q28_05830 [Patescibacteria group bacterium]|nr:hypothetical protein [Patescibacteria group bacterium]